MFFLALPNHLCIIQYIQQTNKENKMEKFKITQSEAPHQDQYAVINETASVCFGGFFGHHGPHKFAQGPVLYEALAEIVAAADGAEWSQLDASFEKARASLKLARGEV